VHGDTSSALGAALASFHLRIPVVHVEAGLRTGGLNLTPFPEELNRQLISCIAGFHLAPTALNQENLVRENIPANQIFVTGNTGIDALRWASTLELPFQDPHLTELYDGDARIVVVTAHRRENWRSGLRRIAEGVARLARSHADGFLYQAGRTRWGTAGMGGNGQFNRLSALDDVADHRGPWRDRLTEDQDLGLRLIAAGWLGRQELRAVVEQQGLPNLRRLFRQRTRWSQGNLQAMGLIGAVRGAKAPLFARAEQIAYLLMPVWQAVVGGALVVAVVLALFDEASFGTRAPGGRCCSSTCSASGACCWAARRGELRRGPRAWRAAWWWRTPSTRGCSGRFCCARRRASSPGGGTGPRPSASPWADRGRRGAHA
jgi:hypothetical protein